jgi:hypothetical protein
VKQVLLSALALALPAGLLAQSSATVGGVLVHREQRTPVEGARIAVLGTGQTASTDAEGRFVLSGIPSGVRVLQARAIGYAVTSWLLELRDGQSFRDTFDLEPSVVTMDTVLVRAEQTNWRSEDAFERRRRRGVGFFITREDILRQRPNSVADLMRGVPGLVTSCRGNNNCVIQMVERSTRPCQPEFFLDGAPATNSTGPNFPLTTSSTRGVEVYRNQFEAPVEFQKMGMRCGVIAIWTVDPGQPLGQP